MKIKCRVYHVCVRLAHASSGRVMETISLSVFIFPLAWQHDEYVIHDHGECKPMLSCQLCCNASVRQGCLRSVKIALQEGPVLTSRVNVFKGFRDIVLVRIGMLLSLAACVVLAPEALLHSSSHQPCLSISQLTHVVYHVYMPRSWHFFPVGVFEKRLMKVMGKLKLVSFSTWWMGHNCKGAPGIQVSHTGLIVGDARLAGGENQKAEIHGNLNRYMILNPLPVAASKSLTFPLFKDRSNLAGPMLHSLAMYSILDARCSSVSISKYIA